MIADVAVRLATLADAVGIAHMSRESIEHGLPWNWRPDRVTRAIRDPDTNVVVVDDRATLGAFGIMSFAEDDAQLLLLAVCQTRRRNGLGSAVLLWLEAVARSAGAARVRVECRRANDAARNFYSEHGYHELTVRKGMYGGVVDGIELEKWLRRDA